MVENKQSAVGGYYSDVKSPKRVYTELDTLIPYLLLYNNYNNNCLAIETMRTVNLYNYSV